MKKTLSLCLAILMVLSFSACASSQSTSSQAPAASMPASSAAPSANTPAVDPIKLTMANVDTETHPCSIITVKFSELVNELSGGAMEVDYYLAGILGEEEATAEACLSGDLDISNGNGGNLASRVPAMGVFSIPFLFEDLEAYRAMLTDERVFELFDAEFQKAGYKLLALWNDGCRHAYSTKSFLNTAEDLQGLKMRTMTSPLIVTAFETIGVKPTPINYAEVYTSLQQGVVEAAENNMNALYDSKHYEVAPYITGTGHLRFPKPVFMNLNKWNSLTQAQQDIVMQAMKTVTAEEIDLFAEMEKSSLQAIIADGASYQEFPSEEKAKLKAKLEPLYATVAKEIDPAIVELITSF